LAGHITEKGVDIAINAVRRIGKRRAKYSRLVIAMAGGLDVIENEL